MLTLRQLFDRETCTFTYLVHAAPNAAGVREALIVDPVRDHLERDTKLVEELGLKLVRVIDTHVHADHITAADTLRLRTGALTTSGPKGAPCASTVVRDGMRIPFANTEIRVIATPGHTDDSMCYALDSWLFTGDTLLVRGCGRTDFQNGSAANLYESVTQKLFALPDETIVLPGHDYNGHTQSTIGEEKKYNARLAGKTRDEFVALMGALTLPKPAKLDEAVPANRACGRIEEV